MACVCVEEKKFKVGGNVFEEQGMVPSSTAVIYAGGVPVHEARNPLADLWRLILG